MPQNISVTTPEALGPLSVPSTGDPRDSAPLRALFQKLLNMMAGSVQVATPTATIAAFAGTAAPTGWLLCNGQAVSRGDFPGLFAAIGTAFGTGNNTTTFNLPDLRGRSVIGVGQGANLTNRTRGDAGGEETHALTLQEMPSHSHQAPTPATFTTGILELPPPSQGGGGGFNDVDYINSAPTSNTGGNASHNNMGPYLALNYIIRS